MSTDIKLGTNTIEADGGNLVVRDGSGALRCDVAGNGSLVVYDANGVKRLEVADDGSFVRVYHSSGDAAFAVNFPGDIGILDANGLVLTDIDLTTGDFNLFEGDIQLCDGDIKVDGKWLSSVLDDFESRISDLENIHGI